MTIEHRQGPTKGRFVMIDNGRELGEMTYSVAGTDKIIIDHTEGFQDRKGKAWAGSW